MGFPSSCDWAIRTTVCPSRIETLRDSRIVSMREGQAVVRSVLCKDTVFFPQFRVAKASWSTLRAWPLECTCWLRAPEQSRHFDVSLESGKRFRAFESNIFDTRGIAFEFGFDFFAYQCEIGFGLERRIFIWHTNYFLENLISFFRRGFVLFLRI